MSDLRPASKVYVGLAEPLLVAGVEPQLLRLNLGFYAFIFILFKAWWFFAITWLIHQVLKSVSKKDPFLRRAYLKYQRQSDRYEPYPESNPKRLLRPVDLGRGIVG